MVLKPDTASAVERLRAQFAQKQAQAASPSSSSSSSSAVPHAMATGHSAPQHEPAAALPMITGHSSTVGTVPVQRSQDLFKDLAREARLVPGISEASLHAYAELCGMDQ